MTDTVEWFKHSAALLANQQILRIFCFLCCFGCAMPNQRTQLLLPNQAEFLRINIYILITGTARSVPTLILHPQTQDEGKVQREKTFTFSFKHLHNIHDKSASSWAVPGGHHQLLFSGISKQTWPRTSTLSEFSGSSLKSPSITEIHLSDVILHFFSPSLPLLLFPSTSPPYIYCSIKPTLLTSASGHVWTLVKAESAPIPGSWQLLKA